jgi:hypothetical protein
MDGTVRVFVSMPLDLRQNINENIRAKPDCENAKIVKCVELGYKAIMGTPCKTTKKARSDGTPPV